MPESNFGILSTKTGLKAKNEVKMNDGVLYIVVNKPN